MALPFVSPWLLQYYHVLIPCYHVGSRRDPCRDRNLDIERTRSTVTIRQDMRKISQGMGIQGKLKLAG